jgi:hypothetical protein
VAAIGAKQLKAKKIGTCSARRGVDEYLKS